MQTEVFFLPPPFPTQKIPKCEGMSQGMNEALLDIASCRAKGAGLSQVSNWLAAAIQNKEVNQYLMLII